jgi:hypothetical protein
MAPIKRKVNAVAGLIVRIRYRIRQRKIARNRKGTLAFITIMMFSSMIRPLEMFMRSPCLM